MCMKTGQGDTLDLPSPFYFLLKKFFDHAACELSPTRKLNPLLLGHGVLPTGVPGNPSIFNH